MKTLRKRKSGAEVFTGTMADISNLAIPTYREQHDYSISFAT